MAYAPTTDFLALLRTTAGGLRTERMPGLDFVAEALARAGLITLFEGQSPPVVGQETTAWLMPAQPSWANEGVLYLWNTITAAYEVATPDLWSSYVSQQPDPSDTLPLVDNTPAAIGTSLLYAREDHVHPTDTTRAPLNSPGFTGVPTAPTPTIGDNSTKVATTAFVASNAGFPFPIGGVTPYAGSTPPTADWVFPIGQAISRTGVTAPLFAICGVTFGSGDGVTTFNLPDLRGRVVAGVDGGVNRLTTTTMTSQALGGTGGVETSAIALANLPVTNLSAAGLTVQVIGRLITTLAATGASNAIDLLVNAGGGGTVSANYTPTGNIPLGGSGTAYPKVQPTIELNQIMRIS